MYWIELIRETFLVMTKKGRKAVLKKNTEIKKIFDAVLTLGVGASAAKIIGILCIPLITRLYSPESFGLLSTFIAIVSIISPCLTLRYVAALPIVRRDASAANILLFNIVCIICLSSLALLGIYLFNKSLFISWELNTVLGLMPLIVFASMLTALYETLIFCTLRFKLHKVLAVSHLKQSLFGNTTKILLGLSGAGTIGLLIGQLVQQASGALALISSLMKQLKPSVRSVTFKRALRLGIHYFEFPLYRLPSHIFMVLSLHAPLLLTVKMYGMEEAGQLGLALMIVALPMSLVGAAAGNAYFSEVSNFERKDYHKLHDITRKVTTRLFFVSVPFVVVLTIAGPWAFKVFFGSEWTAAGYYARALSIYLAFQFIATPISNALTVIRRQDIFLKINFIRFILVVSSFMLAESFNLGSLQTIYIYSLVISFHYLVSNRLILKTISMAAKSDRER